MNNLRVPFQSAYRKHHSVETALLRVHNDILCSLDQKKSVFLVLLDLSAAFDTVDHKILLDRLENRFGIKDLALKWFASYLSNRYFFVKVHDGCSSKRTLDCGVPQGSILGPILFSLYISPISDIINKHGLHYHLYADDTQLYLSFSPTSLQSKNEALSKLENCVNEINLWMFSNKLKLNCDKTEISVLSTVHGTSSAISSVNIAGCDVLPSSSVRNIGVICDQHLSLEAHINATCKACFFHIKNIWKVRKCLSKIACETLVHSFISSKLDFCNSLLYGLSKSSLQKLQLVQNAAARLITFSRRCDHISPVLKDLHWLPIEQRIEYKILLLTFKALLQTCPSYLSELLELYIPRRSLRSSSSRLLVRQGFNLKFYGRRAFSSSAPVLWNAIPEQLRLSTSLPAFKKDLKTYLFRKAFSIV